MAEQQTLQPAASYSPPPMDSSGTLLPAQSYQPPPPQGQQGAPPQAPQPQQGAPTQQGGVPQQGATPQQGVRPPSSFLEELLLGEGNKWSDLVPDFDMNRIGHSPSEYLHNVVQRAVEGTTGAARSLATGSNKVMAGVRDVTGTTLLDKGIASNENFLSNTAPKSAAQQENYTAGDQIASMFLTKWIQEGLTGLQIAKNMKILPTVTKLAEENPHIAKVLGAGLSAGVSNAASTGAMGGSVGDVANAFMTGGAFGAAGEAPNARAAYATDAAAKYKPDVTNIGGQQFTEVSQAARDRGITTQEQEPGLREANEEAYQTLRDQDLRQRAAQGTAAAVNAMEPQQPKVSVAGAQRFKARTNVSTAPPEPPNTNASPREIDQSQRYLQKVLDSNKVPQAVKDKAQVQLDKINSQQQAVTDFKNNPDNYRTETPIDPKVLMQNSTNFGEFADELQRQAERRTPDMQWHERQYDNNGEVKQDALGNEVWKPVDFNSMSRTQQDASIADGDLAKRDVRNLSTVDVKQGLRLSEMAEAAQKLDETTQKIYDLSRERAESVKTQTGQPDFQQEQRTANMQGHIDKLEELAQDYAPQYKDMFGRQDGITDLIAAAKKIGYGDNGQKYSGTMSDYALKTLKTRLSLKGGGGTGLALYGLSKAIGLKASMYTLGTEVMAEAAHRRFMHQVATNPEYANKVLTKDRSPATPLRFTSSSLANLGTQEMVRGDVSKQVQGGGASSQKEDID